ncbi:MAG: hypothetical protein OJF60_001643 [Burkholderiaceae bacterium]|jgi:hypothetical protein|nr:MAG: hypothetical protein OJF60_001643 [Burkholderiaceae bacterium]
MADPTITCDSSTNSCTLVVTAQPYTATADDYTALSMVFGAILAAACLVWGGRQLFKLLWQVPEH